jgi:hypothetical protein
MHWSSVLANCPTITSFPSRSSNNAW